MQVAAAYVTVSGSDILFDAVFNEVGTVLESMPKTLVTSFDFGLTEPEALRRWYQMDNSRVYVSGANRLAQGSLLPERAFHPKLYSFGRDSGTCGLLVGSANLTGRGFSVNTEAAWIQKNSPQDKIDEAFAKVRYGTTVLTESLLDAYEELRKKQPPPPEIEKEVKPVPAPEPTDAEAIPLFRTEIENGNINPANFHAMWIHGEGLQGGSGNQLELPRGAHRFFSYVFDQYDFPNNLTIGQPLIRSGARIWEDRPLTWHGNNRMERMNLPTLSQGGFDYRNSAVMFRRLKDDSFELLVTPWDSDLARSWRQASAQRRTLFRLGSVVTTRLVGLL